MVWLDFWEDLFLFVIGVCCWIWWLRFVSFISVFVFVLIKCFINVLMVWYLKNKVLFIWFNFLCNVFVSWIMMIELILYFLSGLDDLILLIGNFNVFLISFFIYFVFFFLRRICFDCLVFFEFMVCI